MPIPHTIRDRGLRFFFIDSNNHTAWHELRFPAATTTADLKAYADAYVTALRAVTEAGITGYNILQRLYFTDPTPADPAADITDTAITLLNNSASGLNQIALPGINMARMHDPGAGLELDTAQLAVAEYLTDVLQYSNDADEQHVSYAGSLYEKAGQFR